MHGKKRFIEEGGRIKRERHRVTSHRKRERAERVARIERRKKDWEARYDTPYPTRWDPKPWQNNDGGRWNKAPKSYRNQLERQYRAQVKNLMRHERYDDLPQTRRKDADWLWL